MSLHSEGCLDVHTFKTNLISLISLEKEKVFQKEKREGWRFVWGLCETLGV